MTIRQRAAQFFQNVADYLQPDKPPLMIPDYTTDKVHIVTDPEIQKEYHNLSRWTKKYMPDFVVVMRADENGEFQPTGVHKNNVAHLNEPIFNPNFKPEKSGYKASI